jgi:hypothetical protein
MHTKLFKIRNLVLLIFLLGITLLSCNASQEKYTATPIIQVPGVPGNIAVDETHIYWSTKGPLREDGSFNDDVIDGSIMRANLDGSHLEILATGLYPAAAITVDESHVYWMASDGVMKVPKNGGQITKLVAWQAPPKESSSYDKDIILYGDIAVDSKFVFWAKCRANDMVAKVDKNGGKLIVLAVEQVCPTDLEIDEKKLYWFDYVASSILSVTKEGTEYQELATRQDGVTSIAIDKQYLYWANEISFQSNDDNTILKIPLAGGEPDAVVGGYFQGFHNLKIYDSDLYWISSSGPGSDAYLMTSDKSSNFKRKLAFAYVPYLANHMAINLKGIFFIDVLHRKIYFVQHNSP